MPDMLPKSHKHRIKLYHWISDPGQLALALVWYETIQLRPSQTHSAELHNEGRHGGVAHPISGLGLALIWCNIAVWAKSIQSGKPCSHAFIITRKKMSQQHCITKS